jgi:hypothetical protein
LPNPAAANSEAQVDAANAQDLTYAALMKSRSAPALDVTRDRCEAILLRALA